MDLADLADLTDLEVGELIGLPAYPLAAEGPRGRTSGAREGKGILMLKPFFFSFLGVAPSLTASLGLGAGETDFDLSSSGLAALRLLFDPSPALKYELGGLPSDTGGDIALGDRPSLPGLLAPGLVGLTGLKERCPSLSATAEDVLAVIGLTPDTEETPESLLPFHVRLIEGTWVLCSLARLASFESLK
jgi:hypothetical protein